MTIATLEQLEALKGAPLHSEWWTVTQAMIDAFADATFDHQWIHVDAARAAGGSPFGTTIAHGFFTLSLLTPMLSQCINVEKALSLNYGFNRIRFTNPVRCGERIRGSFTLAEFSVEGAWVNAAWDVEITAENATKPALVAQWLSRIYFA